MDFYFKVKDEKFKKYVIDRENFTNEHNKAILKLQKEFELGNFSFVRSLDVLNISNLNKEDSEKLKGQLFKNGSAKPKSKINIRYKELIKGIKPFSFISPVMMFDLDLYGKMETNYFILDNEAYLMIRAEQEKIKKPDEFEEIKASEFHLASEKHKELKMEEKDV